jgi:hypothetical protein
VHEDASMQEAEMQQVSLQEMLSIPNCPETVRLPVIGKCALPLIETIVQLHRHGMILVLLVQTRQPQRRRSTVSNLRLC